MASKEMEESVSLIFYTCATETLLAPVEISLMQGLVAMLREHMCFSSKIMLEFLLASAFKAVHSLLHKVATNCYCRMREEG